MVGAPGSDEFQIYIMRGLLAAHCLGRTEWAGADRREGFSWISNARHMSTVALVWVYMTNYLSR